MKKWLKRFLPWVLTGIIFCLLFLKTPPQDIIEVIRVANLPLLGLYAVIYFSGMLILDGAGIRWAVSRFSTMVTTRETILMRGVTYLLMVINYNLAQGGMAFFLRRTHKAPIFKTLSSVFFISLIDLMIVLSMAFVSVLFGTVVYQGIPIQGILVKLVLLVDAGFVLWILFWKNIERPFILKLRRFKIIDHFLNQSLFFSFREARIKDYVIGFALRLPAVSWLIVGTLMGFWGFGITIPISAILTFTPIIMLVGTLPLTPGGLGTSQALCIAFFSSHVSGATLANYSFTPAQVIMSATLLWALANLTLKCLCGLICLKFTSSRLFEEMEE